MAKPRIFVSSTYYDLRHIRDGIEVFIKSIGYESVLFESGDIPFDHRQPLDQSCYNEIANCQILVMVVGGRYGSSASDEARDLSKDELENHYQYYNSITKKEFETAIEQDIPVYIFVDKGVDAEFKTFKENKRNESIKYAHVDSVNIFRLIEDIHKLKRNNLIRPFENLEDITTFLRDQWAGLFQELLRKMSAQEQLSTLAEQVTQLSETSKTLKRYIESLMTHESREKSEELIEHESRRIALINKYQPLRSNPLVKYLMSRDFSLIDIAEQIEAVKTADEFFQWIIDSSNDKDLNRRVRNWILKKAFHPAADLNSARAELNLDYIGFEDSDLDPVHEVTQFSELADDNGSSVDESEEESVSADSISPTVEVSSESEEKPSAGRKSKKKAVKKKQ